LLSLDEDPAARAVPARVSTSYDAEPKSEAGKRTVEIDELLVASLGAHRKAESADFSSVPESSISQNASP
jgi:hypothetical protein